MVLLLHIDHPTSPELNRSNREPASKAAGQPVEEVVLEDDDEDEEDDEDALPLTLSGAQEACPAIPESARYTRYARPQGLPRRRGELAREPRALVDAGVKVGHARAIIHTAAQPI